MRRSRKGFKKVNAHKVHPTVRRNELDTLDKDMRDRNELKSSR